MSNLARQMLVHLIFITITAIVAFATYAQITHPFGFTFWLAVFAVIASLVGYLLYIARVIKTKMPIVNKLTTAVAVVILALVFEQIEKYIGTEHISGKQDKRTTIAPYYPIKYYFDDYLNDKGPPMDFVSLYQHKPRKRTGQVKFPTSKYLHTIDTNLYHEGEGVFATDIRNLKIRLYQGRPQLLLDGKVLAGLARMKTAQAKGGYQGIPFENVLTQPTLGTALVRLRC